MTTLKEISAARAAYVAAIIAKEVAYDAYDAARQLPTHDAEALAYVTFIDARDAERAAYLVYKDARDYRMTEATRYETR